MLVCLLMMRSFLTLSLSSKLDGELEVSGIVNVSASNLQFVCSYSLLVYTLE